MITMTAWFKKFVKLNIALPRWNARGWFTYYGQKVYFPKNSAIFKLAMEEGIYELHVVNIIIPLIKQGTEVFDIGANIGVMAIPILSASNDIKVISVEASPNSLPYLERTSAQSAFGDRWVIVHKAVSEKDGKIRFYIADEEDGAYDSMGDTQRVAFKKNIEIDSTTIDIIWKSRNKPAVSFIKSDIEGADLLALRGGTECIQQCRPSILIEWNAANIKPFAINNRDLYAFTQAMNYTLYTVPLLNKVDTLNDLELYSNHTENFLLMPNDPK
jgi:FkbM family methyltransferase